VKLLKLEASNIFSLGHVEVNLKDRGLILVTGHSLDEGSSNGSGKSSIANKAILWCLYGYTAGGLKADDILNRHGDTKTGWGKIDFEGSDGSLYAVHRARPAKLDFYKDGVCYSMKKAAETQALIDHALGLDFKSFLHTYMFGQGRLFSYASLPPADQKAILEQILPVEQLAVWVDYAKTCVSDLHTAEAALASKGAILQSEINTQKNNWQQVQDKAIHWNTLRENKLKDSLNDIAVHKEVLAERDSRLVVLKDRLAKLPDIAQEIRNIDTKLESLNSEINDCQSKMHLLEERKSQWDGVRLSSSAKMHKIVDSNCPTCHRAITDEAVKNKLLADNVMHSEKMAEAAVNMATCATMYHTVSGERGDKIDKSQELFRAKMELEVVRKEDTHFRVQIAELTALENNEEKYTKRAEQIASERNPFFDLVASFDKGISELLVKQAPLEEHRYKVSREIEHINHWLKVFGHDIRIKLFESVCNYLDTQTNEYLKQLKNPWLRVQFSTIKKLASGEVKEDFNVRVFSEKGGEGFETLSGGEQQIVSFAIGKALGDLSKAQTKGSSELTILDEPFTMLDSRNCEALVEFLTKEKGTILLISNDENLANLIPDRIHVIKENGVTRISNAVYQTFN